MSDDDDNYGSEEEYEYQYSDDEDDDDNSSSQPMAIDSDVGDDASDGSRKRKAGSGGGGSNGAGGAAADSRRRSGSNVHNAMMELIGGGGGELLGCFRGLIFGVSGGVAGLDQVASAGRANCTRDLVGPSTNRAWSTGRISNFCGGSCPGSNEVNSAGLSLRNCIRPTHARWCGPPIDSILPEYRRRGRR